MMATYDPFEPESPQLAASSVPETRIKKILENTWHGFPPEKSVRRSELQLLAFDRKRPSRARGFPETTLSGRSTAGTIFTKGSRKSRKI